MNTILITGIHSLLGQGLLRLAPKNYRLILALHKNQSLSLPKKPLHSTPLDITHQSLVQEVFKRFKPHMVIHAAALSDVDYCEKNRTEAYRVNVEGTKYIVNACKRYNTNIMFVSSNAVFDGKKSFYSEQDFPHPLNFYGTTKLMGENIIAESGLPYVIVRLITMYGWQPKGARPNPVTWLISKLEKGEQVQVVDDVFLNPLYNIDAAHLLWRLIQEEKKGIYHVGGSETTSRYQWMIETAKTFGFDTTLITPVSSRFFAKKIAKRPRKTIYSIEKIEKELHVTPRGVREGLRAMRKEKESDSTL